MAPPRFVNPSSFPIQRLFPNVVTILALCAGLIGIRFALLEKWEIAVSFILLAAFSDAMDGRLARLLNTESDFGAQMDSLADFLNFGFAPVFMTYLWLLKDIPYRGVAWGVVLFFSICTAVRLARFNSEIEEDEDTNIKASFFTGIPAPAGGLLILMPMMLSFEYDHAILAACYKHPVGVAVYVAVIGLGLVSRIPTLSSKNFSVSRQWVRPFLLVTGMFAAFLLLEPWIALPILGLVYVLSIPFGVALCYRTYGRCIL